MESVKTKIREIYNAVQESYPTYRFDSKTYNAICSKIKKEMPEHYRTALKFAETSDIHTSRGARTCHYLSFDIENFEFTENQKTKVDNLFQGEYRSGDPKIGKKHSKSEILFEAAWLMAIVMEEDGNRKTY